MRKIAASKVYINKEEFYSNHVVELFDDDVVKHYPLAEEQAMTEWLGGIIVITNKILNTDALSRTKCIDDFFKIDDKFSNKESRKKAYHIANTNIESEIISEKAIIKRVF